MKRASNNGVQLAFSLRPLPAEPASLRFRLPFAIAPRRIRLRARRLLGGEAATLAPAADLFLVRQYAEDVTLLEQIEQQGRAFAREQRRRATGHAVTAWTAFSCTSAGRKMHAVKEALISQIESEEAALCG